MKPPNKYHAQLINSFTSENIIGLFSRYKNASKEITESFALLSAAKTFVSEPFNNVHTLIIGDGASPRTGAVFAYYTTTTVTSIDPNFNLDFYQKHSTQQEKMGYPIQRLTLIKSKIEDLKNTPIDCNHKTLLTIWPHSHADMNSLPVTNYLNRYDIALPCCIPIPLNWQHEPHITYIDKHILSPKNTIHIWLNYRPPHQK